MTPPDKPFTQTVEVHLMSLVFVGLSWAYVAIAVAICSVVREVKLDPSTVSTVDIHAGLYLEPKVSPPNPSISMT
jgi:hypothetical protein